MRQDNVEGGSSHSNRRPGWLVGQHGIEGRDLVTLNNVRLSTQEKEIKEKQGMTQHFVSRVEYRRPESSWSEESSGVYKDLAGRMVGGNRAKKEKV